jgi:hypothetical protein
VINTKISGFVKCLSMHSLPPTKADGTDDFGQESKNFFKISRKQDVSYNFRDVYSKSERLMPNDTVGGNQFDLVLGPMARPIPPALGNAQGTRKPITVNTLPSTSSKSQPQLTLHRPMPGSCFSSRTRL